MDQVFAEKQSEQTNINAAREVSLNQVFGEYTTSEKEKKKGRKRKRNKESWKQNIVKSLRNAGKSYTTKTNETIKPRSVQLPCRDKCKLKCSEKINVNQR